MQNMMENLDQLKKNGFFQSRFFTFINPFLSYIDGGGFFRWPVRVVYVLIGLAILLFPVYLFVKIIQLSDNLKGSLVATGILFCIILLAAGILSFQLWWNRQLQIPTLGGEGDDYPVTPIFAHLVQTFGEWLGAYIAVAGFFCTILATVILGKDAAEMEMFTGGLFKFGVAAIIMMPIKGFLIILVARFISEQVRALAAIAVNTRQPRQ